MTETKLNIRDYCLLIIIFILPYMEGGPWFWMYAIPFIGNAGPAFVSVLCSSYLWCYGIRKGYKNNYKVVSSLVWIAAMYTIVKLIQTISIVGLTEALTIYRKNYIYLLSFAMIMNYMSNMDSDRIIRLIRVAMKICIPITLVYYLQCFGLPIFSNNLLQETSGGVRVMRNILGFPPVVPVILSGALLCFLYDQKKRYVYFVLMIIIACFISYTRNIMITAILVILLTTILFSYKYGFRQNFKLLLYTFLFFMVLAFVAPESLSFWSNLIDSTFNVQLEKGIGTYAIRQKLIEIAFRTITEADSWFTGIGYVRDVAKGEYSLVLGTDTYLAPIIWCEGVIGLTLRCLPIVWLLFKSFSIFKRHNEVIPIFCSTVIIASVLSQVPNYVQTTIFMNYCFIFGQSFLLLVLTENYLNDDQAA